MLGVLGNADPMGVDDDSDDELFKPASAFGEPGAQWLTAITGGICSLCVQKRSWCVAVARVGRSLERAHAGVCCARACRPSAAAP